MKFKITPKIPSMLRTSNLNETRKNLKELSKSSMKNVFLTEFRLALFFDLQSFIVAIIYRLSYIGTNNYPIDATCSTLLLQPLACTAVQCMSGYYKSNLQKRV